MILCKRVLIIFIFSLFLPNLWGEEVPPMKFVDIVLKILTYDRELEQKVSKKIFIGIISPLSKEKEGLGFKKLFDERSGFTVKGFPFEAIFIGWKGKGEFLEELNKERYICLILLDGLDDVLSEISFETKKRGILTITPVKRYIKQLSLSVVIEEGRIVIYRNDESLKSENLKLGADFLKITRLP